MRVEVRNLSKRFGRVPALTDVCFELAPGQRVALAGPNGSGKSTVNRVLMGLVDFTGEVRIDGRDPFRERVEVARRTAYVPQIAPNLSVPVRELVRCLTGIRGDPEQTGALEKLATRLDLDLEALARRPFRDLSGGTKQKLLVALALSTRASLLVLDEPTGSLDPRSRERVFELLHGLDAEATVVLCSHRLEEIRQLVDRVLLLEDGRLVFDGSAAAFLDASSRCLVEMRCMTPDGVAWLRERGFREGAEGWWIRACSQPEKLALLRDAARELGDALTDLNVRDFEALDLPGRSASV